METKVYYDKKEIIHRLEMEGESRMLSVEELSIRSECLAFVKECDSMKQQDIKQKSRVRWAVSGDENSKYFHNILNANLSSSRLHGLVVNGVWESNPSLLKEIAFDFFEERFREPVSVRPKMLLANITRLSEVEARSLVAPFTLVEIKEAVWDCNGDRAPGPDGFNFKFLKRFWNCLQHDFVRLFDEFFNSDSFSFGCMSSFIALIPKAKDPVSLNEFRPISLIGCVNKVISKVMVGRLKNVIGGLISEEQSAFIANRSILDGPLILNEVLSWLNKLKKRGMIFKVDIEKAYDSLNWGFLDSVMEQMNFPDRWRKWVSAILSASRASVLVNGSPTREFKCFRGLRQGDPLSPFLFVIAMEALTSMMKQALDKGLFHGLKCGSDGPLLSHFLYADDAIFVGEWSILNALNICRILRCFYLVSGLRINLSKCRVFGTEVEKNGLAEVLRCKVGDLPFIHLGLQVGKNMNGIKAWDPVVEIFRKRLSLWKAKQLSVGGRITVLKSVLNALPTY